ncbi:hypothetical protein ABT340_04805 [Streptosporangium sp. NPDC000239]|uniref:hypothetical protein n=1 Tax=Streptosporangium sp. NPDC000239 TaxID=3154248 RepID=UPI003323C321
MTTRTSGLEYAARYTHTYRDGRTITVTSVHHETPDDQEWALERVAEMVRAQQALGRPVNAHLLVRRAATDWKPAQITPISIADLTQSQHDGWACITCGKQRVVEEPMVPAGRVPAMDGGPSWQVFRCVDCPPREVIGAIPTPTTVDPADVPVELVEVVLRQRGLAALFADTGKIRAELAEILSVARHVAGVL